MQLPSTVFVQKRDTISLTMTTDLVSLYWLQRVEEIDALALMITHVVSSGTCGRCKALPVGNAGSLVLRNDRVPFYCKKTRTNGWLQGLGLQLPSDTTNYGSISSIAYPKIWVKNLLPVYF